MVLTFRVRRASIIALASLAPISLAQADILYGSTGNVNSAGGGRIYIIDTVAHTASLVGDTGFDRTGGLDFDAAGTLYVVAGGSAGPGTLLTFDLISGGTTVIGPVTGMQGVDALAFNSSGDLLGGGWSGASGVLVTINPGTGGVISGVTLIGSGNAFVAGLAFHPDGRLFGSRGNAGGRQDDIVLINPTTGVHTPLGPMEAIISDIAFGASGTMYGCDTVGRIYEINPTNGAKTLMFSTGIANLAGLTGSPPSGCYPDCDTSTGPGVLDIFDFLCFGNRFAAGDPYACDCDVTTGPNVCDIFDFLCFGNAFNAGCP